MQTCKSYGINARRIEKLGASLIKGYRSGITAELRNLIDSGFFYEPKNFSSMKG